MRRLSRRRHRIVLHAPPYRILGTAHLPPGAEVDAYLARTPNRWMPLTDCNVTMETDDLFEAEVDVAIVNLTHVRRLERVLTLV